MLAVAEMTRDKPDQHTTGHRRFTNKPGLAPGFSFEPADAKAPQQPQGSPDLFETTT